MGVNAPVLVSDVASPSTVKLEMGYGGVGGIPCLWFVSRFTLVLLLRQTLQHTYPDLFAATAAYRGMVTVVPVCLIITLSSLR